jgi:hypothetical protein
LYISDEAEAGGRGRRSHITEVMVKIVDQELVRGERRKRGRGKRRRLRLRPPPPRI